MISHMARPPDDNSGDRRPSQSAPTMPDGSGAPRTLAMWSDSPRTTPRSVSQPDFSKTVPYIEAPAGTDNGRPTPTSSSPWARQSPLAQPGPGWSPLTPLSVLPPYGGSVADALRRRPRWGLWIPLAAVVLVLALLIALPFFPRVPLALRPVRDAVAGLTGWGTASDEVATAEAEATAAAPGHPARGPRIVPMPVPAPVMAAPPADPRLRRAAAVAAARAGGTPRMRAAWAAHNRAALALSAPANRRAATDPFEDGGAPAAAAPRAAEEPRDERPAAAPPEREAPAPVAAPPPREAAPPPARPAAPAGPKPAPGSLDDLMATAVQNPPPKGKSELDKKLAGIDETQPAREARPKAQEAPAVHSLTRSEIQAAMKAVQPKINDCGRQFEASGAAELKVTVGEDGTVKVVNVTGVFANTPTAACVERAVKTAQFPPSGGLRFDYPISLH
jgi:hypothetical protein